MKILDRYIYKEILRYMGICMSIFVTIYLTIDVLGKIDNFMEASVQKGIILKYFFYKIPFIIVQMTPVAMLISVMIVFSLMKRNNELIALNACGISIYRIAAPAIVFSLLIIAFVFFFSELIVPYTSSRSETIWNKEVRKGRYKRFFKRRHIWYKGKDSIYWIEYFDGKNMIMKKAIFYFFDKNFHLFKRVQTKEVLWSNGFWIAKDGIIQTLRWGKKGYDIKRFKNKIIKLPETPESFLRPIRRPEEMNYWQLKRFAKQIEKEGYDAKKYLIDTYVKLSFPFINLVIVLVGIPVAIRLRGSIPLAISIGIGICFLYILCMGIFRSLGISGIIPPFLSAWLANIMFLLFGIYMMIHI